jgi:hypothetical protein
LYITQQEIDMRQRLQVSVIINRRELSHEIHAAVNRQLFTLRNRYYGWHFYQRAAEEKMQEISEWLAAKIFRGAAGNLRCAAVGIKISKSWEPW